MSLTSHINSTKSANDPVLRFFEERFPNTSPFVREPNKKLRAAETIGLSGEHTSYTYATLGTAIDYRLRYYFGVTPFEELVAWNGALTLVDNAEHVVGKDASSDLRLMASILSHKDHLTSQRLSSSLVRDFFSSLEATLRQIDPVARSLENPAEENLARFCIVLALLDQAFRSRITDNSLFLWMAPCTPFQTCSLSLTPIGRMTCAPCPGYSMKNTVICCRVIPY